jgi:hypothetical protein
MLQTPGAWGYEGETHVESHNHDCNQYNSQCLHVPPNDPKQSHGHWRLAVKKERQAMNTLVCSLVFASDVWVAPSAAAFIVILSIVALLKYRMGNKGW